ncbi:unnamed protein product [Caenorhabditis auriculariae]|uniref:Uncharacterized protein n=1 Tax=Caenorhabditis auriculariae TaxID=2777116 RepID=A0A8S1H3D7_9PELO|nr:unnamed protein product [Caenorhabditis auriculariae]
MSRVRRELLDKMAELLMDINTLNFYEAFVTSETELQHLKELREVKRAELRTTKDHYLGVLRLFEARNRASGSTGGKKNSPIPF